MTFHAVDTVEDVLAIALERSGRRAGGGVGCIA